jgi:hypothetical protein
MIAQRDPAKVSDDDVARVAAIERSLKLTAPESDRRLVASVARPVLAPHERRAKRSELEVVAGPSGQRPSLEPVARSQAEAAAKALADDLVAEVPDLAPHEARARIEPTLAKAFAGKLAYHEAVREQARAELVAFDRGEAA